MLVLPHPRSLQLTTRSNSSPSQAPGKSTVYSRKPCVCWVPIKCIHCYYCSATQSCLILRSHALQHSRPPCPSLCPRVCLKFISFELVMPSNHLILCCPLFLLPSVFPRIRVFCNELSPFIRWPNYCSFTISPFNEYSGLISDGKESACSAEDLGLIPGSGRSSGEGKDYPLQYSCLENFMGRGV